MHPDRFFDGGLTHPLPEEQLRPPSELAGEERFRNSPGTLRIADTSHVVDLADASSNLRQNGFT